MSVDIGKVKAVATDTRRDFEKGLITDDEVIAAAVTLNAVSHISESVWPIEKRQERIKAGTLRKIGMYEVSVPVIGDFIGFPEGFCSLSSIVLAKRLSEAGALGESTASLVDGGCGEDTCAADPTSYYHNFHVFLDIGATVLGQQTIVDITADQFKHEGLPPVYVGPLVHPWSDEPRIELWGY